MSGFQIHPGDANNDKDKPNDIRSIQRMMIDCNRQECRKYDCYAGPYRKTNSQVDHLETFPETRITEPEGHNTIQIIIINLEFEKVF